MKKYRLLSVLILLSLLLYGCGAAKKPMYYWGNYSQSLYSLKKNQNDTTTAEHLKVLDDILLKSKERAINVPPGIYAEYGYYMLTAGKKEEAKKMFQAEKDIYPESTALMDRMIKSIN